MSFVHDTIVGHFDPATLFPDRPLRPLRPLDPALVESLLAQYPPGVREHVSLENGYLIARWAPCPWPLSKDVKAFAYHLAERSGCVAAESPFYVIGYPPAAAQQQREAADARQ